MEERGMGRIRRGGYLIDWWIGDHTPKHVHVYRDGVLVAKVEIPGAVGALWHHESPAQKDSGATHRGEGHMRTTERIRAVRFDNRKRVLHVDYASGKRIAVHYGQLGITRKIVEAWVDKETRGHSIGIRLQDGSEEYMPYDQPLALARDPEYLLRTQIEHVLARMRESLAVKGISKRYLATQLGTSDNQIQRLLDPSILNKNLEQLYRISLLLGLELEWRVRAAA